MKRLIFLGWLTRKKQLVYLSPFKTTNTIDENNAFAVVLLLSMSGQVFVASVYIGMKSIIVA